MKINLKKAVRCLLHPLQGGGSFFLFTYALVLLVLFPVWFLTADTMKVSLLTFVEAFADVYLLAWVLSYLPKFLRHLLQSLVVVVALALSVTDFFVKLHFQTFINSAMLRLVMETRSDEVGSFFSSYVWHWSSLAVLLPFLLWGGAWYVYVRHYSRWSTYLHLLPRNVWVSIAGIGLLVGEVGMAPVKWRTAKVMGSTTVSDLEQRYGDASVLSLYSSFHRFLFACRSLQLVEHQIVGVRAVHERMVVECDSLSVPKVVVIIGESYNRSHSQLYGYPLSTTPHQLERAQRGELFPFKDVVSCWNLTSYVFQNLMSLHSVDSQDDWADYPLFPAIYKKAGYRVTFLTNQFPATVTGSISSFSGSFFLNDPVLHQQLFDVHNDHIVEPLDDARLVAWYDSIPNKPERELVLFSLIAQHFNYDKRIPSEEWNFFNEQQYLSKNLKVEDRQILADYDNATRYNDHVIESILQRFEDEKAIVIYCPDHGEELFDGSGVWGRTYPEVLSDAEMHNQFEIPFWVWTSQKYRAAYPEKMAALHRAQSLPFMSDDLPHLLLPLTGVSCAAYDSSRSPLSSDYNAQRKRILRGWQEYHK